MGNGKGGGQGGKVAPQTQAQQFPHAARMAGRAAVQKWLANPPLDRYKQPITARQKVVMYHYADQGLLAVLDKDRRNYQVAPVLRRYGRPFTVSRADAERAAGLKART
jgi:hypothetical protein